MKTVNNYQEIGHVIDSCKPVVFTCHPTLRVSVAQQPWPNASVKLTMHMSIGDTTIGTAESEYSSMDAVLEAFQIDDLEEIWEVLE